MPEKTKIKTSIGGSALIEGIMMRGPKKTTVAVRMSDKSIYTEDIKFDYIGSKSKLFRLPLIRGFITLIDSLRLSMKCLMLSAEKSVEGTEEENEEPSKFEKWLEDKLGDKVNYNELKAVVNGCEDIQDSVDDQISQLFADYLEKYGIVQ